MPRQRKLVTEKLDTAELHSSAIKKAIKLHSPYAVVPGDELALDEELYYVVYRAPLGGDRRVYASRSVHSNAIKLRDMLNEAWAEGFYSSGRH